MISLDAYFSTVSAVDCTRSIASYEERSIAEDVCHNTCIASRRTPLNALDVLYTIADLNHQKQLQKTIAHKKASSIMISIPQLPINVNHY